MRRMFPMMLVRIIVGLVFVTEGALKFIFPDELGVGRFAHIGFISPSVLSPFVGGVEIAAGAAVLMNLYAGDAALLLLAVIVMAIVSPKIPILLGRPWGPFSLAKNVTHTGWLGFLHEARTDLAMLFCLVAIVIDSGARLGRQKRWYQRGA